MNHNDLEDIQIDNTNEVDLSDLKNQAIEINTGNNVQNNRVEAGSNNSKDKKESSDSNPSDNSKADLNDDTVKYNLTIRKKLF